MTPSKERLKYNIKRLAAVHDKSLTQVADEIGVPRRTLYYQTDEVTTGLKYDMIDQLADYFKVDTSELFKDKQKAQK